SRADEPWGRPAEGGEGMAGAHEPIRWSWAKSRRREPRSVPITAASPRPRPRLRGRRAPQVPTSLPREASHGQLLRSQQDRSSKGEGPDPGAAASAQLEIPRQAPPATTGEPAQGPLQRATPQRLRLTRRAAFVRTRGPSGTSSLAG